MPKAVSDSSTLIHLAGIGRLKLLRQFYKKILIPPAVWKEVVEEGQSRPGAREVEEGHRSGWIAVSAPLRRLKYISKFEFRNRTIRNPPSSASGGSGISFEPMP
ncbi:hypothetical protein KAX17_17135 [Candidatus Bipolaricaulota bacterium]|nr:hypothetical protein [Candidatus Bipolaricaulota bacterium]MCK4599963.1 hypothetical protein [Candidatus Bipolaricaulota bacterium]